MISVVISSQVYTNPWHKTLFHYLLFPCLQQVLYLLDRSLTSLSLLSVPHVWYITHVSYTLTLMKPRKRGVKFLDNLLRLMGIEPDSLLKEEGSGLPRIVQLSPSPAILGKPLFGQQVLEQTTIGYLYGESHH